MNQLNPRTIGLAVGAFVGGAHLIWTVLIAFGWAQALASFVLWAHMISTPVIVVGPFDIAAAGMLVGMTFVMGYVAGSVFALLWNLLNRTPRS